MFGNGLSLSPVLPCRVSGNITGNMGKRILVVLIVCVVLSLPVYFIGDAILPYPSSAMLSFVVVTIGYAVVSALAGCYLVMHESVKKNSLVFKLLLVFATVLLYVLASWVFLFVLLYIIAFFAFFLFGIVMM